LIALLRTASVHTAWARLEHAVGGPARRRVVVTLALVLALDSADKATLGVNATQLERGLHIGTARFGLLLTLSSAVGALATIPAGALVDRVDRTRLLAIGVAAWGVAMLLSGVASGYAFLLCARLGLGATMAISGPAVASLLGDYVPEAERGRMYGYVLAGELIGAGFGFVVVGEFAIVSWRVPFLVLVAPSALVCWLVHRLPEPARGGAGEGGQAAAQPADVPLWRAVVQVLRVRTNVVLIVASALGYFFFSGVRGFAVQATKQHYGVPQSVATSLTLLLGIGMFAGLLSGGRVADRLTRRGRAAARLEVPGCASLFAALLFVPAFITSDVPLALPLMIAAAFCLGATNPPMDAARLDVMPARLWGRAEAVRTVIRSGADAGAPLLFGVLASTVFSGPDGLHYVFLTMLAAVAGSSIILLAFGRRTYPRDVAAAGRSRHSA
jgi:predicted MFS family arabinose efflux permease